MGTSPSHAAGLTCTCPRAGAPIPVAYAQAPGLPGYARYPCIDAQARSDFPAGCPAAMNLTRYGLAANPGRACWVNGTLAVRSSYPHLTLPPCSSPALARRRGTRGSHKLARGRNPCPPVWPLLAAGVLFAPGTLNLILRWSLAP